MDPVSGVFLTTLLLKWPNWYNLKAFPLWSFRMAHGNQHAIWQFFFYVSLIPIPAPGPSAYSQVFTCSFIHLFPNLWATWGQRLYIVHHSILSAWDMVKHLANVRWQQNYESQLLINSGILSSKWNFLRLKSPHVKSRD